jgi:hypothetical protein
VNEAAGDLAEGQPGGHDDLPAAPATPLGAAPVSKDTGDSPIRDLVRW